jgi:hypothetical protein
VLVEKIGGAARGFGEHGSPRQMRRPATRCRGRYQPAAHPKWQLAAARQAVSWPKPRDREATFVPPRGRFPPRDVVDARAAMAGCRMTACNPRAVRSAQVIAARAARPICPGIRSAQPWHSASHCRRVARKPAPGRQNMTHRLVPPAGLEPARPCGQQILSLPRLPIPPRGRRIGSKARRRRGQAGSVGGSGSRLRCHPASAECAPRAVPLHGHIDARRLPAAGEP